ncbi:MAG: hypothetical protein PUP92_23335 [Rhizonema sp. PD38]|nr:hypothetical protein [Rhizonema sp. PD37]MDF5730864.1 hypothetical protein [Rhizonema sp. PD38]
MTAPACKDVPSCIVTGTVIIGGILYYVIKNTATGVIRRVPAKQVSPPIHRTQGDYSLPGSRIEKQGFVFSEEECEMFAREQERKYGGKWTAITHRIPMNTPEGDMSTRPGYICAAERES